MRAPSLRTIRWWRFATSSTPSATARRPLLVVTEWNQFRNPDFQRIRSLLTAPLLFDGRNLYSPSAMAERGFAYFCIGRKSDAC